MNVIHQGDITILDDAYNANPQSMRAALEILSQTEGAYRAAVLGDMFELGDLGPELHRSMGECAGALGNIDGLLAVGELAWNIYDAAHQSGITQALYARDRTAAKELLPNLVRPGAVILVKASRGMAFEELTREIQRLAPRHKKAGSEDPAKLRKVLLFPKKFGKEFKPLSIKVDDSSFGGPALPVLPRSPHNEHRRCPGR